jgi:hypothetical protein
VNRRKPTRFVVSQYDGVVIEATWQRIDSRSSTPQVLVHVGEPSEPASVWLLLVGTRHVRYTRGSLTELL